MNKQIKTRLAPSPTGFLHIGTARTALFNYLFAKKIGGKFIIRIEDTDTKRSTKGFEKDILEGLDWLGLKWDEQIYYQKNRIKIYQKFAQKLIEKGCAYKKEGAIWFKLDSYKKENIKYNDLIQGRIEFKKDTFNDFVIIKSDGIALYQFANVIDDYEMQITHVIRGADHINSTPQQIMLYESLGFQLPKFGHIPLILNSDKTKMSKRKNPVSISKDFRKKGYLSQAIINYIALLGWSPKNDQEIFTIKELIKNFKIENINKSPAIFDIQKLNYFNNYYIKNFGSKKILNLLQDNICENKNNKINLKKEKNLTVKIIDILKERMQTICDFWEYSSFFYQLPNYQKKLLVFKKSNFNVTVKALKLIYKELDNISNIKWDIKSLNNILLKIIADNNFSNGDVFWPVRVALSGMQKSPSPTEILWVLGKKESLRRIKKAINNLK